MWWKPKSFVGFDLRFAMTLPLPPLSFSWFSRLTVASFVCQKHLQQSSFRLSSVALRLFSTFVPWENVFSVSRSPLRRWAFIFTIFAPLNVPSSSSSLTFGTMEGQTFSQNIAAGKQRKQPSGPPLLGIRLRRGGLRR